MCSSDVPSRWSLTGFRRQSARWIAKLGYVCMGLILWYLLPDKFWKKVKFSSSSV